MYARKSCILLMLLCAFIDRFSGQHDLAMLQKEFYTKINNCYYPQDNLESRITTFSRPEKQVSLSNTPFFFRIAIFFLEDTNSPIV